jgi:hypothetical protein
MYRRDGSTLSVVLVAAAVVVDTAPPAPTTIGVGYLCRVDCLLFGGMRSMLLLLLSSP